MSSIDPDETSATTPAGTTAPRSTTSPPGDLFLGVIVWTDDPEDDPTVIADRNPVVLTRAVAVTIHQMLEDSDAYAGATEFLQSNPPPQDCVLPEDVDAWLEALRETTPHPACSFHQVPMTAGTDGTNHTSVNRYLQTLRVLVEREKTGEGRPLLDRARRVELEAMLFAADSDIRVADPADPAGAGLYAGQASEAHEWMPPGVYDATGYDRTGQFRLVVGRAPVGDGVTASAAFPPAEHDSAVVNKIARILEQDTEQHDPATVLDRINATVLETGRTAATPSGSRSPEQALQSSGRSL